LLKVSSFVSGHRFGDAASSLNSAPSGAAEFLSKRQAEFISERERLNG
jgi:hypothetical protein